jgi:hypothetical protein
MWRHSPSVWRQKKRSCRLIPYSLVSSNISEEPAASVFEVEHFSVEDGEDTGNTVPHMNNAWRHRPECYNFLRNFKFAGLFCKRCRIASSISCVGAQDRGRWWGSSWNERITMELRLVYASRKTKRRVVSCLEQTAGVNSGHNHRPLESTVVTATLHGHEAGHRLDVACFTAKGTVSPGHNIQAYGGVQT